MATYRKQELPLEIPTECQMMWIAGFLEGEGCFCPMSGTDKRARISANQKQREPLEKLLRWLGGRIYTSHTREMHIWMLRGEAAKILLPKLRPLMSPRRQGQIDKTLSAAFSVEHGSIERFRQKSMIRKQFIQAALSVAGG